MRAGRGAGTRGAAVMRALDRGVGSYRAGWGAVPKGGRESQSRVRAGKSSQRQLPALITHQLQQSTALTQACKGDVQLDAFDPAGRHHTNYTDPGV